MIYRALADLAVLFHFLFVIFVAVGGLLVLRWPRAAWVHVPAALWGVLVELTGWPCPLTPLENAFRTRGGLAGYEGGFIEHHLLPIIYPAGLDRHAQVMLGGAAFVVNVAVYWLVLRKLRRRQTVLARGSAG